jgi:hypothetical protein
MHHLLWEDIIRTDLRGKGWESMELAQDRIQWRAAVSMVMKLWAPQKAGNFLTR